MFGLPLRAWQLPVCALLFFCHCSRSTQKGPTAKAPLVQNDAASSLPAPLVRCVRSTHPPSLCVTVQDPRLGEVYDAVGSQSFARAIEALRGVRAKTTLEPEEACAWDYLEGTLALSAKQVDQAALAFDRAAKPSCPASSYAEFRAIQSSLLLGLSTEALPRLRAMPVLPGLEREGKDALAEALRVTGDRAAAVPLWRGLLTEKRATSAWVNISVLLAQALLEGVDGPPTQHAQEVFTRMNQILLRAPKQAEAAQASALRDRALDLLPKRKRRLQWSPEEWATRIQAWEETGNPTQALEEATHWLSTVPKKAKKAKKRKPLPATEPACRIASVRAKALRALGKPAEETEAAWGEAIRLCVKSPDLHATALFSGARASRRAKHKTEADTRFQLLEQEHPTHRYADDALFHRAELAWEAGDEARFVEQMRSLKKTYPAGDMWPEGLFQVALLHMARGAWQEAKTVLEEILSAEPEPKEVGMRGRTAYFLARAEGELGHQEEALKGYMQVVQAYPMSYFMVQAYSRLAAADAARARHVLAELLTPSLAAGQGTSTKNATSGLPPRTEGLGGESTLLAKIGLLLELGEVEVAQRLLSLVRPSLEADPPQLWLIARLFLQAEAYTCGSKLVAAHVDPSAAHAPVGAWKAPWEIAYPPAFSRWVAPSSARYGVDPALAWGIMRQESAFQPDVRSAANAYGLMQIIPPTARAVAKGTDYPYDPSALLRPPVAIPLGAKYLSELSSRFPRLPLLSIPAYNAGPGAVQRWLKTYGHLDLDLWIEKIGYEETKNYTRRVLANRAVYLLLYGEPKARATQLALPLSMGPPLSP